MEALNQNGVTIAIIDIETKIETAQDMLDLIASARYQCDCDGILLHKESMTEAFFDLKTGLAGEVLQKCSNYGIRLAVIGDFDQYRSKNIRAFMSECNRGNQVFFKESTEEGLAALRRAAAPNDFA